jgi:hypothetical protein
MLAVRGWSANGRKQQPRGCEPARDRDPSRPSANILSGVAGYRRGLESATATVEHAQPSQTLFPLSTRPRGYVKRLNT